MDGSVKALETTLFIAHTAVQSALSDVAALLDHIQSKNLPKGGQPPERYNGITGSDELVLVSQDIQECT